MNFRVQRFYIPRLNSTLPSFPPRLQNSGSRDCAETACLCGKAANARGRAKSDVVKIKPLQCCQHRPVDARAKHIPRFTGSIILGLCFSHSFLCNLININGGIAMTGVEFSTRLRAVSPTASVAAFLLLPKLCASIPSFSFCCFSASPSTGYTSIPCRISSPRIRNTLRAPADATAAKGIRRESVTLVVGETRLRRGTMALSPNATEQEAETASKYDWTIADVDSAVVLLAFALLIATLRD